MSNVTNSITFDRGYILGDEMSLLSSLL